MEASAPTDFHAFLEQAVRRIDSPTLSLVPSAVEPTLADI